MRYLKRHWAGQLSLGVSYWVNGVALSILLVSLSSADISSFGFAAFSAAPTIFSLALILFWLLIAGITTWQLVGIWRSANRHARETNRTGWATLAKFGVFTSALSSLTVFLATGLPQVAGLITIIREGLSPPRYTIQIIGNGDELEIRGFLGFGVAREVEKQLAVMSAIRVVHLNSEGGRITDARKLRDLLSKRRAATYSSAGCYSACTLVFMAGERRVLAQSATLGFHRASFPGVRPEYFEVASEGDRLYFLERGVAPDFVERAFGTSETDLWKPTRGELFAAGVITEIGAPGDVAVSGSSAQSFTEIESALLQVPLYSTLKEHEPEAWEAILSEIGHALAGGASMAEVREAVRPTIEAVYVKYLPRASDEALADFARLFIDQLTELESLGAEYCYASLGADPEARPWGFSPELGSREMVVMAKVIASGATSGLSPPAIGEVSPLLEDLGARVADRFGEGAHLLGEPEKATSEEDKHTLCEATRFFYESIVDLPSPDAGRLLRYMLVQEE